MNEPLSTEAKRAIEKKNNAMLEKKNHNNAAV